MEQKEKSRTQKKKEDRIFQEMGEELVSFSVSQLDLLNFSQEIYEAISLAKKIKSHAPLRRQTKYIGTLLRKHNLVDIQEKINTIKNRIKKGEAV